MFLLRIVILRFKSDDIYKVDVKGVVFKDSSYQINRTVFMKQM